MTCVSGGTIRFIEVRVASSGTAGTIAPEATILGSEESWFTLMSGGANAAWDWRPASRATASAACFTSAGSGVGAGTGAALGTRTRTGFASSSGV